MKLTRAIAVLALAFVACGEGASEKVNDEPVVRPDSRVQIVGRQGKLKQYPCMQCHDKVEELTALDGGKRKHDEIEMKHFAGSDKCIVCHNMADMNTLRLLTGELASLDEAFKVCGQCHADRLKDWEIGAHGKQMGSWNGVRHRSSCPDCHNPHAPAIAPMQAVPPPPVPPRSIPKKGGH